MQEVYTQKLTDQVLELLESDESLGPKILQLHRQGFFDNKDMDAEEAQTDPDKVFPKGETHHGKLTLKNIYYLFKQMGLPDETVDSLCSKSKLQQARMLWCWFNDCDLQDKLPTTTLRSLMEWARDRMSQLSPHLFVQIVKIFKGKYCTS